MMSLVPSVSSRRVVHLGDGTTIRKEDDDDEEDEEELADLEAASLLPLTLSLLTPPASLTAAAFATADAITRSRATSLCNRCMVIILFIRSCIAVVDADDDATAAASSSAVLVIVIVVVFSTSHECEWLGFLLCQLQTV